MTVAGGSATPLLEARGISKSYPGVLALDGVDFDVLPGEVHALVGENGSGKSTLLKILAGQDRPDAGSIAIDGTVATLHRPGEAIERGVTLIAQEVVVAPHLSVAENILLGRMPKRSPFRIVDWPAAERRAAEITDSLGLDVDPGRELRTLPVDQQQLVAIGRALALRARVILMDEPTSSLSEEEVTTLFAVIRQLRDAGAAIVLVSHRVREIREIADRATVLRDGRLVGVRPLSEADDRDLVRMMVGRDVEEFYTRADAASDRTLLSVEGLGVGTFLRDVDLEVRRGEVLGLAGLVGSGRSLLLHALFGSVPWSAGRADIDGEDYAPRRPTDAIAAGVALVPEDRKGQGLLGTLSVRQNVSVSNLAELSSFGVLQSQRERAMAERYVHELDIKCAGIDAVVRNLSGGNQQKVILARWLARRPKLLLLDEPTRGIDVGAKGEIYRVIADVAATYGVGVIVASSELLELLGICDRIVVLSHGRVTGELSADEATEERIAAMATSVATAGVAG